MLATDDEGKAWRVVVGEPARIEIVTFATENQIPLCATLYAQHRKKKEKNKIILICTCQTIKKRKDVTSTFTAKPQQDGYDIINSLCITICRIDNATMHCVIFPDIYSS